MAVPCATQLSSIDANSRHCFPSLFERNDTQVNGRSLLGILCSIHLSYGGKREYQLQDYFSPLLSNCAHLCRRALNQPLQVVYRVLFFLRQKMGLDSHCDLNVSMPEIPGDFRN